MLLNGCWLKPIKFQILLSESAWAPIWWSDSTTVLDPGVLLNHLNLSCWSKLSLLPTHSHHFVIFKISSIHEVRITKWWMGSKPLAAANDNFGRSSSCFKAIWARRMEGKVFSRSWWTLLDEGHEKPTHPIIPRWLEYKRIYNHGISLNYAIPNSTQNPSSLSSSFKIHQLFVFRDLFSCNTLPVLILFLHACSFH